MQIFAAVVYAIVLWWVSTGAIIVLYRRPAWTYDATFGLYTVVAALAAVTLYLTRNATTLWAVYAAFSAGTLLWGWNLAAYYTGTITGFRVVHTGNALTDAERFKYAVITGAGHEAMSVLLVVGCVWGAWGATNLAGFGCVVFFYTLHMLSKLVIYFGVPNFSGAWLPAHLQSITAYFGPPRVHWFAFGAVGLAIAATVWCISGLLLQTEPAGVVTHAFWALLCGAAVLELGVLMIPEHRLHRFLAFLTHLSGAANTKML